MKSTLFIALSMLFFIACGQHSPKEKASETKTEATKAVKTPKTDLTKLGIANEQKFALGGLKVGDAAPAFIGKDQNGVNFILEESLKEGPVVVIFYRGFWCGYCNQQLQAFETALDQLKSKGVTVVAISPESNEYALKTVEKTNTSISIISDGDQKIMTDYKVGFQVTEAYQQKVKKFVKKDLTEMSGHANATLPIPATYVIGKDGKIAYSFYDPDYSKRADVKDILAVL